MIFIFDEYAGETTLKIKSENFKYLFKVRRHQVGDVLFFRNKENRAMLYSYEVLEISNKDACLQLIKSEEKESKANKFLHLAWCKIDPKSIEKVIASLNELGVEKITFVQADRSQKNFKIDYKRLKRLLDASCMQCGRSSQMQFEEASSVEVFLKEHPECVVINFSKESLNQTKNIQTVLIGPEGGFSEKEQKLLKNIKTVGFNTPLILRSEHAAVGVVSILLL